MIKAKTMKTADNQKVCCMLIMDGAPSELGLDMEAIIRSFVLRLLQDCVPGRELSLAMFLDRQFSKAVHEAYQEHAQGEKHEAAD